MKFNIIDYEINKHISLDSWIDESNHPNAKLINKFATFNEPLSDTYQYFLDNTLDMANIKSFLKVFEHDDIFYGTAVFHYYEEDNKYYLAINPIINPEFINQGFGTNILKQIVVNAKKIAGGEIDVIKGDTNEDNIASIKILEKVGFKNISKNDIFLEYVLHLGK